MKFFYLVLLLLVLNSSLLPFTNATRSDSYTIFSGGSGSSEDPYRISTVQDLHFLRDTPKYYNRYFILTNNITFNASNYNVPELGWKPIGNATVGFSGNFEGAGYSILDLFINRSESYLGIFGNVTGRVNNLNLLNCQLFGYSHIGCLAGYNSGTVSNIFAQTHVSKFPTLFNEGQVNSVGGLIGYNKGSISNIIIEATVKSISYSPYLSHPMDPTLLVTYCNSNYISINVGYNSGTISNASAYGSVLGCTSVGGFVGFNSGFISSSSSAGNITGEQQIGGLAGDNSGSISSSSSAGKVTGVRSIGGLVGSNSGSVYSSISDVNVAGALYAGGLVGNNSGSVLNSSTKAILNGQSYSGGAVGINIVEILNISTSVALVATSTVGGVVGSNSGNIFNLTSFVNVSLGPYLDPAPPQQTNFIPTIDFFSLSAIGKFGGIAGYNSGNVSSAAAYGSVEGSNDVGGAIGRNYGKITQSFVYSNITGNVSVGGLTGTNFGLIQTSFSFVNVAGNFSVGGLIGFNNASIVNSYASGTVTGNSSIGGLVGVNQGLINSSFSNAKVSGVSSIGGLVGSNSNSVFFSYYDLEISGLNDTGKGVGVSSYQLRNNLTLYREWNSYIWKVGFGYPQLLFSPQPIVGKRISISDNIYYDEILNISWLLTSPKSAGGTYLIEKNGSIILSNQTWSNNKTLTYSEILASPGVYQYTIRAYDSASNYYIDSIIIIVNDHLPKLSQPIDRRYYKGEVPPSIYWDISSVLGTWSFSIYQDGIKVLEGDLQGFQRVAYKLENLTPEEYNYTIVVVDRFGNIATETVTITVLPPKVTSSLFIDSVILLGSFVSFLLLGFRILDFTKSLKRDEFW